jgi:hypothetical protein
MAVSDGTCLRQCNNNYVLQCMSVLMFCCFLSLISGTLVLLSSNRSGLFI